ncbi:MAG TPA: folate-binding protein [Alphaproteobacteria bacterium]
MSIAHLTDRSVIAVSGDDRITFLNGLISQDMMKVTPEQPLYGCLLTPQGKYFADFLIIAHDDQILLDVHVSRKDAVINRLKMFVLRSKVTLSDAGEQYKIYAAWHDAPLLNGYNDPRYSGLGLRVCTADTVVTSAGLEDYHAWRIQNGVPDVADFDLERTALLEANLDLLHGVAWDKGCYMGQELTARTHYRGLIKKRLLPFTFSGNAPAHDTPLMIGTDTIGHTRSIAGNHGMALIKMEYADRAWGGDATLGGQTVIFSKPAWFII